MAAVGRLAALAAALVVLLVLRRVLMVKGMFIAVPYRRRTFRVCLDSVQVHVGTRTYVMTGWVSNYNPWVPSTITIGNYCSINSARFLLNGNSGHTHGILCSTYQWDVVRRAADRRSSIVIGNDVWIGQDVMILGGVTVGDGAIVGAGAVVTRDVAPYAVVAGNPAVVVKLRYTERQIRQLLRIRWWDMDHIEDLVADMQDLSVDAQIRMLKRVRRHQRRVPTTYPVSASALSSDPLSRDAAPLRRYASA